MKTRAIGCLVGLALASHGVASAAEPAPFPEREPAPERVPRDDSDKPDKPAARPPRPAKVDPELATRRDKAQALVRRGQELAAMGRREEALEAFSAALAVYPAYPLAHHEIGVTQAEEGELVAAAASFKKAIDLAPDFTRARQALGEVLRRQKRFDEALAVYQKALAQDPMDLASWYGVAAALRAQKKNGEALYALKKLVAAAENPVAPAVLEAQREIALLEEAGVSAKVWGPVPGETEAPEEVASGPGALPRHAGDKAFAERRYLAALEAYRDAWSDKTPEAVLAYKIGATFALMMDRRAALDWWRRALAAEPGRELIARHLALLVGRLNGDGMAIGPAPGDADAIVRAKEALRQGDPGTALYLVIGLDQPGAASVEAEARLRLGDFERARALYEEVLGADPDDRVAKGGLAEALLRMGQTSAAEKAIQAWVGAEGSEGGYKARPETFLVFRRGEVEARLLAPPEPED